MSWPFKQNKFEHAWFFFLPDKKKYCSNVPDSYSNSPRQLANDEIFAEENVWFNLIALAMKLPWKLCSVGFKSKFPFQNRGWLCSFYFLIFTISNFLGSYVENYVPARITSLMSEIETLEQGIKFAQSTQ